MTFRDSLPKLSLVLEESPKALFAALYETLFHIGPLGKHCNAEKQLAPANLNNPAFFLVS